MKVKINDVIEEKEFYNEAEAIQELEGYKKNMINDYSKIIGVLPSTWTAVPYDVID